MLKRDDALRLLRSIAHHAGAEITERENKDGRAGEVTLEIRLKPDAKPGVHSRRGVNAKRFRILHVEDTDHTANLVFYYLRANYDVDSERTAEDGLARALENEYDYVIVDLDLRSAMGAFDLVELLRETDGFSRTPIIALGSYRSRKDVDRCVEAGCTAFLSKPFLKEDLLHLMSQLEPKIPAKKRA